MTTHLRRLWLLAAVPVLVTGCATARADGPSTSAPPPATSTAAGDGSGPTAPSDAAQMVCGEEIRGAVQTLLALPAPPQTAHTWDGTRYTCTYHLADGPLVLSVTQTGSPAAARAAFSALQRRTSAATPLRGLDSLGLPAFESVSGITAFVKDDKTLEVDASRLPAEVGGQQRPRGDLSYTVATDVLGCWNGD